MSANSPALLTVAGANKHYNNVPALIDVSLELFSGEVHALVGENGAGKSTLIRLLAGVLTADTIQTTVRGIPQVITDPRAAFALGLRFIHQELNVVRTLSVAENIFLTQPYPRRAGILVDWHTLNTATSTVLERLGIFHLDPRTLMARLSPGDQMLVKIAGAFVGDDAGLIYVMDEPTAALTGEETATLFRVIRRMRERGCAILYVSHRMDEIFQIADRVTVLRDGQVAATRLIGETDAAELIRLMTGRDMQQIYPPRTAPIADTALLDVRDLRTDAINGVTFKLRGGEILGVAGLIGSGRTELIRALVGADRVIGGEVWLEGQRLTGHSPRRAWHRGMAFVPEERRSQGLILSRSIGDNVALPHLGKLSRVGVFLDERKEHALTHEVGLAVRLKAIGARQIARELSGGNQQKVVFARALAHSPRVLLLDEPTRGVDVGAKYDIYALIREASAHGVGIIIVSSELTELIGLCDRILVMRGGRLIDTVDDPTGLTEGQLLTICYGEASRGG